MSCYTRHLGELLSKLGMEDTKENKKILDKKIREVLGKKEDGCPDVWKEVKIIMHDPTRMEEFVKKLKST